MLIRALKNFGLAILIASLWPLLFIILWYAGILSKNIEFNLFEACMGFAYTVYVYSPVLFITGEIITFMEWEKLTRFLTKRKNLFMYVILLPLLYGLSSISYFQEYPLWLIYPAFFACCAVSLGVYLRYRKPKLKSTIQ